MNELSNYHPPTNSVPDLVARCWEYKGESVIVPEVFPRITTVCAHAVLSQGYNYNKLANMHCLLHARHCLKCFTFLA